MQIGAMAGLAASIAGQSSAQRAASEGTEAASSAASSRQTANQQKAEASAGIGAMETDDVQTSDRDADGRQVLAHPAGSDEEQAEEQPADTDPRASLDPEGDRGKTLDILA